MSSSLINNFSVEAKYEAFYTGGKLQFSLDGKHIFCLCGTKIQVLNVITGKIENTFGKEEEDEVITFILSPNNKILIAASRSGIIRQWNLSDNSLTRTWKSIHTGPIAQMAFDSESILLATGGSDSSIKIWDIVKQYCTHNLKGAQGVFSTVHFHPDSSKQLVFGTANDYRIHIWNLSSNSRIASLEGHYSMVTCLAFTEDGSQLVSSGRDKVVILWDLNNYQMIKTVPIYEAVESVILIPKHRKLPELEVFTDELHFITAGEKGVLRVWHSPSGQSVYTQSDSLISLPEDSKIEHSVLTSATYNSSLDTINIVTYEHNIILYKLEDFSLEKQFIGYNDEIIDLKLMGKNESHLAVATNSPHIKVFELSTFNCQLLKGHSDLVMALDVFPTDNFLLASSSKDNTLCIWRMSSDTKNINCVFIGYGHTRTVSSIICSRLSTKFLLSGSNDTTLKLWTVPEKIPLVAKKMSLSAKYTMKIHEKDISCITLSPNDRIVATGSMDKTAKLWSADNLSLMGTCRGHKRGLWCVTFSPVDQILATSSADGTIKLWSISDFDCLKTFEGHASSVLRITFVNKGMQMISSASDGNMKLWTLKTTDCTKTFTEHNDKVWALITNSSEKTMITGGADSIIILWKDVTEEEKISLLAKQEQFIQQDQELSNLVKEKKWIKAMSLAITLEQPHRALNVIKEILMEKEGKEKLENTISQMKQYQIDTLIKYATSWNTNSKNCYPANLVISCILKMYTPDELLKLANTRDHIEALLPYTERHFQRMNRVLQQSTFVQYIWDTMKIVGSERQQSLPIEDNILVESERLCIDSNIQELSEDQDLNPSTEELTSISLTEKSASNESNDRQAKKKSIKKKSKQAKRRKLEIS